MVRITTDTQKFRPDAEPPRPKFAGVRTGNECFYRSSNDAVFSDPRGVVMATGLYLKGRGLGNMLFGTAGLIAWGIRLGASRLTVTNS